MSNRRNAGAVRGPASALTSFLAGLGVQPSAPLTTWGNASSINGPLAADGPVIDPDAELDPAGAVTARNVEAGPSTVADSRTKRSRSASMDSDDLDAPVVHSPLKAVGEFMTCAECSKQFTVTAYTKPRPKGGHLCVPCCYALGIDPFAKAKVKKVAKKAPAKETRVVKRFDDKRGALSLGDICVTIIGKYIEDVEQLGDIGHINMDKVCRIICRGRLLTPETAPLFYSADRRELALYDCTRLVHESYLAMANLCPNLDTLRLLYCGQMTTDALVHLARLPLRTVELYGPFLVRELGWKTLFENCDLETLLITQSPRIDLSILNHLVAHCPNLKHLRLDEIGKFDNDFMAPIAQLPLLSLDISSPTLHLSDDEFVIPPGLTSLTLVDHPELTDAILPTISKLPLRTLKLSLMPELTDAGVATLFGHLPNLVHVDFEKGHDLADAALLALIESSSSTLSTLSILGWREVSSTALANLTRCTRLTQLNLGWCRQVTDFLLKDLLDACPDLHTIWVWGCNQLTDACPRRRGVKIIGVESHSI